ncbi:MAG: DUF1824 family protein [Cyanobacteria bacterium]|nr:DUF1824 family protein [Cyanobacteriota bacterium]
MISSLPTLSSLRGLRTAPALEAAERAQLRQELQTAMGRCEWFTIGVMAPNTAMALNVLRQCEAALSWPPLDPQDPAPAELPANAAVFLKGNQRNGRFLIRAEAGLGEGVLITGHQPADAEQEDTWGPLPLDLFAAS